MNIGTDSVIVQIRTVREPDEVDVGVRESLRIKQNVDSERYHTSLISTKYIKGAIRALRNADGVCEIF